MEEEVLGRREPEPRPRFQVDRSLLIRLFGYRAAFFHGDAMVWDRWRFVKRYLPATRNGESLMDAGCGTGACTIGAAKRGYRAIGLSWDARNQQVAQHRAAIVGVSGVRFPICDLRELGQRHDLVAGFDVVLSLENIEHILDDRKLFGDLVRCLRPGGYLILTAPNYYYHPVTADDMGPFSREETGWHVRRGYTASMLRELAELNGMTIEDIGSCSGFFSQRLTWLSRKLGFAGWAIGMPLRVLPPLFDRLIARITGYPDFSICMVAYKPRFS